MAIQPHSSFNTTLIRAAVVALSLPLLIWRDFMIYTTPFGKIEIWGIWGPLNLPNSFLLLLNIRIPTVMAGGIILNQDKIRIHGQPFLTGRPQEGSHNMLDIPPGINTTLLSL